MVGDTDPPKVPKTLSFRHQNSRTCGVETNREFSAAPAPRIGDPPVPEMQNPATVAAGGGVIENGKRGSISIVLGSTSWEACHVSL